MQNNKAPERIYALLGKHTYEDGSLIITGYSYIMGDVEYIRADLVEANQIPGRCGECAERRVGRNSFGQYSYCMWKNGEFDPDGYCDEWKSKE